MNSHKGLTLVTTPGFEVVAEEIQAILRESDISTLIVQDHILRRSSKETGVALYEETVRDRICVVLATGPGTPQMMNDLYFTLGGVSGFGPHKIYLVLGYQPGGRSDKDETHEDGRQELSMSSFYIHMIFAASYGMLRKIIVVDPHAQQTTLQGPRIGTIRAISTAAKLLKFAIEETIKLRSGKKIVIHFPDKGACDRFSKIYHRIKREILQEHGVTLYMTYGNKLRIDSNNVKILGIFGETEHLKGAHVITMDDEGATFNTNAKTEEQLAPYQPHDFSCAIVHLVASGGAVDLLGNPECPIARVFTTDTIPIHNRPQLQSLVEQERIIVLSWTRATARVVEVLYTGNRAIYPEIGYEPASPTFN